MKNYPKESSLIIVLPTILLLITSCASIRTDTFSTTQINESTSTINFDTRFERLVMVDSFGVTGADGVISFPLNRTTSLFMMGDSFLTPIVNKKRAVDSKMINNTFILINKQKNTHKALYGGTLDDPKALLVPTNGNPKEYYWPGHGFEHNGLLHLFMSRFIHVDYGWGFEFSGTDYIRMDGSSFKIISQDNFPFSNLNNVHYGHSVIKDKEFIYSYGAFSDTLTTGLHIMRSRLNQKKNIMEEHEFYDGSNWVKDPLKSVALKGINRDVPEQFSVFKHGKNYILIMEERNLISGNIYSYIADSPTGPWRNPKLLYHTLEQDRGIDNVFTYNAMAHPQYIENNELLVSYCVNSFDIPKIHEVNTDYYRPRFIRIPMRRILE